MTIMQDVPCRIEFPIRPREIVDAQSKLCGDRLFELCLQTARTPTIRLCIFPHPARDSLPQFYLILSALILRLIWEALEWSTSFAPASLSPPPPITHSSTALNLDHYARQALTHPPSWRKTQQQETTRPLTPNTGKQTTLPSCVPTTYRSPASNAPGNAAH